MTYEVIESEEVAGLRRMVSAREVEVADLAEALHRMTEMHSLMMSKVNHGSSFYDAKCIKEMNEAPIQASNALAGVKVR